MFHLEIVNFQSIANLEFDIDGFTVVKGRTSSGKSAIRRAIRFLLHNEWDKSFLRNGEKECRVTLSKDNEWSITRIKGDKKNSYLIDRGGSVTEYNKIGTDVPTEFKDMGISLLEGDGFSCDVIVYCQRDPLFVTAYSQIEKTHVFNQLFGTYRCELAGKLVKRDIVFNKTRLNQANQDLDSAKKELLEVQEVKEVLSGMLDQFVQLESLEKLDKLHGKMTSLKEEEYGLDLVFSEAISAKDSAESSELLSRYCLAIASHDRIKEEFGDLVRRMSFSNTALDLGERLDSVLHYQKACTVAEDLAGEAQQLKAACKVSGDTESFLGQLEAVSGYSVAVGQCDSLDLVRKQVEDALLSAKCLLLLTSLQAVVDQCVSVDKDISSLNEELGLRIAELPEVCPTCGQSIPHTVCA